LNTAINVDELYHVQKFEFQRKSSRQGRSHTDIFGCKIIGLGQKNSHRANLNVTRGHNLDDDGTRKILAEGCEYRIPKLVLMSSWPTIVKLYPTSQNYFLMMMVMMVLAELATTL
jgi:hypothetical protein